MAYGLARRLAGRFIFVVGKGGVGKSTAASALALRLADRGETTHLISTDPAHSLGELFELDLDSETPSAPTCGDRLTVEELDAHGRARRWFGSVRDALAELMDLGTYLDEEDIDALLDQSLPGMDEVMAAVRLAELARSGELSRIVVDTAPTGHTLHLLDCAEVVRGWSRALEAMADKAGAVAVGLTGRRIRLAGERVAEELGAHVTSFREDVLAAADFLIVTRGEGVVAAETARLADALLSRGLSAKALLAVGGSPGAAAGPVPVYEVPHRSDLHGCHGLRQWGTESSSPPAESRPWRDASVLGGAASLLPARELTLFAGKGGVGKTTCAAAYATALAHDRDVLLLSLDPAGSLDEVLDAHVGSSPSRVFERLEAAQLDAESRFDRFRERYASKIRDAMGAIGLRESALLDRRVLESMLDMAPPGVHEVFALDAVLEGRRSHDVLVLDTAPTGHFLRLLEMPEVALSWMRTLLRILLKYRAALGGDDLAPDLLRMVRRLRELVALVHDGERAGVVVVSLPEPLPRRESGRLLAELAKRRVPVDAVVVNRVSEQGRAESVEGDAERSVPTLVAPLMSPPPTGLVGLGRFADLWSRA